MKNSFPNSLFKMALLCGVITASAGAGQFAQYYYSVGDLRAVSLAEWAGDDLGRQSAVKAFTQECNDPLNNFTWYSRRNCGERNHDARTRNQTMDSKAQG